MKNVFNQAQNLFTAHYPRLNDFGFKMTDNETHYSVASLNESFSFHNGFPFDVSLGFKFINKKRFSVALFEVNKSDCKTNGTKLVVLNTNTDINDLFINDVKPLCPPEIFDEMLLEASKILEAMAEDFKNAQGDLEAIIAKANPFFDSFYTVSKLDPNEHLAHIIFSTDGIYQLHAIAPVKIAENKKTKLKFVVEQLNTHGDLENSPANGEEFSLKIQTKLNKLFHSNKYLGIR